MPTNWQNIESTKMRIRLFSDLHAEFWTTDQLWYLTQDPTEVLILAGDIAVGPVNTIKLLNRFANFYEHVIYTPGNHEYYGHHIDTPFTTDNPNIHINTTTIIKDTTFVAATLWPNFGNNPIYAEHARKQINDFRHIKGFTPTISQKLHNLDKNRLLQPKGKRVIVSHFAPAMQLRSDKYPYDALSHYFHNDLDLTSLKDATWCYGHTHEPIDTIIGTTRVMSNPRGYHQDAHFNNTFTFEI